jgi:surface antigen
VSVFALGIRRTLACGVGLTTLMLGASSAVASPSKVATRAATAPTAHVARHHKKHHLSRRGKRTVHVKLTHGGRGGTSLVDDYPAALKNRAQDSVLDDWKEFNRECTSFVAFRLASRAGFTMPFYDDAINWGPRAQKLGYSVNDTPAIGAVAWTTAHGGHVAWVADVQGTNVVIEQYNADFHGHYSYATVPASSFKYIHFKDQAPVSVDPPPIQGGSTGPIQGSTPNLQGGNGNVLQPGAPGPGSGGGTPPPAPVTQTAAVNIDPDTAAYGGTVNVWSKPARNDFCNASFPTCDTSSQVIYSVAQGQQVTATCVVAAGQRIITGTLANPGYDDRRWVHLSSGGYLPNTWFARSGLDPNLPAC